MKNYTSRSVGKREEAEESDGHWLLLAEKQRLNSGETLAARTLLGQRGPRLLFPHPSANAPSGETLPLSETRGTKEQAFSTGAAGNPAGRWHRRSAPSLGPAGQQLPRPQRRVGPRCRGCRGTGRVQLLLRRREGKQRCCCVFLGWKGWLRGPKN